MNERVDHGTYYAQFTITIYHHNLLSIYYHNVLSQFTITIYYTLYTIHDIQHTIPTYTFPAQLSSRTAHAWPALSGPVQLL
jgi:hypothetical protein